MKKDSNFDYDALIKKALEQFRSGKFLFGRMVPSLLLKESLEAEIEEHLDDEERENGTRKNGQGLKRLKTAEDIIQIRKVGSINCLVISKYCYN